MPQRLILGQHPQGPYGLFISKPGVDVMAVGPADTNNLLFSSEWGAIVNVLQAGITRINQDVVTPAVGYRPYVRIEEKIGNTYNYGRAVGFTQTVGVGQTRRYDWTQYRVTYSSDNVFRVVPWRPELSPGDANQDFRYVVLNFPINQ